MKKMILIATLFLTYACLAPIASAKSAEVMLKGTEEGSPIQGTVLLQETETGLKISASVTGAPPGIHGFHIHENGSCEDKGNAAGGHFNPDDVAHGHLSKDGFSAAHAGDLGNLTIDDSGSGKTEVTLSELSLTSGKYNVAGKAIILHEKADDFGQPTGNAGGRIACGIISPAEDTANAGNAD